MTLSRQESRAKRSTPGSTLVRAASLLILVAALHARAASAQAGRAATVPVRSSGATDRVGVRRTALLARVLRGRALTLDHGCGGCHGGSANPSADGYLAGMMTPDQEFLIGPCAQTPGAQPCWKTRPRNLTPDNMTGLGRFSERQLFNALRFGLRPGETPDVTITSNTPGEGNFPLTPKYLAPPMPWMEWRHMSDEALMDIVAYLKHGVKPVRNKVLDSEGPPDFWASEYTVVKIGTYPAPRFPAAREKLP